MKNNISELAPKKSILQKLKGLEDSVWHNNTKQFLEKVKEEIHLS